MKQIIAILVVILLLIMAGGVVWLSGSPMMPPTHTVEQAIPDDHIPH